jgi:hypothetical protein
MQEPAQSADSMLSVDVGYPSPFGPTATARTSSPYGPLVIQPASLALGPHLRPLNSNDRRPTFSVLDRVDLSSFDSMKLSGPCGDVRDGTTLLPNLLKGRLHHTI